MTCCRQRRPYWNVDAFIWNSIFYILITFYLIHIFYTIFILIFFQNIVESLGEILFVKDWSRVFFRLWWMQMVTKKMMTVRMITTSSQPGFDAKIPHLALALRLKDRISIPCLIYPFGLFVSHIGDFDIFADFTMKILQKSQDTLR